MHDWQPLAGGGEVRLLAITHGTVHAALGVNVGNR
jgi:transcriptional regulator of nitric oxide reductase